MRKGVSGGKSYFYHNMRPVTSSTPYYVATRLDNTQTTEIVITSDGGPTERHRIHYKTRDKYTFKVGAGLTIENVEFTGGDSYGPINRAP